MSSSESSVTVPDMTAVANTGSAVALPPWHRANRPWDQVGRVSTPSARSGWKLYSVDTCVLHGRHTVFYLDPHDHCEACRTAGKGSKCDWAKTTCVLCTGMQPWARELCRADARWRQRNRTTQTASRKLAADRKRSSVAPAAPAAAVGSARVAELKRLLAEATAGNEIPLGPGKSQIVTKYPTSFCHKPKRTLFSSSMERSGS